MLLCNKVLKLHVVLQGACVLDPFAGSGRLLQACAAVGASHTVACDLLTHRVCYLRAPLAQAGCVSLSPILTVTCTCGMFHTNTLTVHVNLLMLPYVDVHDFLWLSMLRQLQQK